MKALAFLVVAFLASLALARPVSGQGESTQEIVDRALGTQVDESPASSSPVEPSTDPATDPLGDFAREAEGDLGGVGLSRALEIALLLTALSLLPAVLITLTSFTRIVIVLSFVRRSLAVQELPPNPILIGLALFLTTFVMGPVVTKVHAEAYVPYRAGTLGAAEATERGWGVMRGFLLSNTRESELELFADIADYSGALSSGGSGEVLAADGSADDALVPEELPFRVVVPAFVLSELKTAFQMGFLLFLPFLVIDLVVASVLISMGMFMLPPVMISTPFKILLFVLVDGWHLVCESLVTSFVM